MRREHLLDSDDATDRESADAMNDDDYAPPRASSRAETLRARRRVESLLEERRLRRAIEDDWAIDEEE